MVWAHFVQVLVIRVGAAEKLPQTIICYRDIYVPGEKIWFKAYLTDAATHRYPTGSRYVYAELNHIPCRNGDVPLCSGTGKEILSELP